MIADYPLRFAPIFRRYLWGGRRLATLLGKEIGGDRCAESWEVVDHGTDQSVVTNGPLAGAGLGDIVRRHGDDLFGRHAPLDHFPLLFKFLDAQQTLSVQVHPNDAQGALLDPPDQGKTEAWVVLAAEPGSRIYAGLKRGFDRHALEREIRRGRCAQCLHAFEPAPGDCLFVPAGTVHALGEGLVVAEIQQASDTTFRLFDWNRMDSDGRPRALHIDQALDAIDFERGPVGPVEPQLTNGVERLVACDKFVLQRRRLDSPQQIGGGHRFHLLAVVEGEIAVSGNYQPGLLRTGHTTLLPAAAGTTELQPISAATLLDICLP